MEGSRPSAIRPPGLYSKQIPRKARLPIKRRQHHQERQQEDD
jgi:hypothetical protein